ncbi:S24 family peptidase, partial [Escherichia coli]
MDKYEQRRLRLIEIRDRFCNGKASELARRIEREPSYVSRMLYPEGKSGKKRIADDMMELIEKSFNLPRGWMDMLADGKAGATD